MNEPPSNGIELETCEFDTLFEDLLLPRSNDDEDLEDNVQPSQFSFSPTLYSVQDKYNSESESDMIYINGNDDIMAPFANHTNIHSCEIIDFKVNDSLKKEDSLTTDFIESPEVELNSEASFSNPVVDIVLDTFLQSTESKIILPTLTTKSKVIVQIKKHFSKKSEGHYKVIDDVIVSRYFSYGSKRITFQTVDTISHGDTVNIFLVAKKLEKKRDTKPLVHLEKDIPDNLQCNCFSEHKQSRFCVVSENATVDWDSSGDGFVAVLRPVSSAKLEFEIGLWSTKYGDNYVAQLVFQLCRDGKTYHQKFFIKTCAYLVRDITSFSTVVNSNFGDRCKWFEEQSNPDDGPPPPKKMRVGQVEASAQICPLLVQCPSENTKELLNLLEDKSQYEYFQLS